MTSGNPSADVSERAAGCLVGAALGDALGVPYEYGSRPLDAVPRALGGGLGGYAPGEWSDDTQMTICIARAALEADLRTDDGLDAVARHFEQWFADGPADVGIQTRQVLSDAGRRPGRPADRLRSAAADLHARTGRTAGNGALMRTAPVALALGDDRSALADAARRVAELTHPDPLAGDACVLWCAAIADAVWRGERPQLSEYVGELPAPRRDPWMRWLAAAGVDPPAAFPDNGFTVTALQAAWAAVQRSSGFLEAVHAAIGAGGDTDTVAAIAGALAGAQWPPSVVPGDAFETVHGWPGWTVEDIAAVARSLCTRPNQP